MINCKVDIIEALKSAGYSTYRIRKGNILGQATIQKLRNGGLPSWGELNKVCGLLDCQPGDIIEYVPDTEEA